MIRYQRLQTTNIFIDFSFHDCCHLTDWFLAHRADPNRRCYQYTDCNSLSIAFQKANFEIIQILLDHGASLQNGQVFRNAAIRELDDRLGVLQYLLDRGHTANDIMYQNCGDKYYFHIYSGIGIPLYYAAAKGCWISSSSWSSMARHLELETPLATLLLAVQKETIILLSSPFFTLYPSTAFQRAVSSSQTHPVAIFGLHLWKISSQRRDSDLCSLRMHSAIICWFHS